MKSHTHLNYMDSLLILLHIINYLYHVNNAYNLYALRIYNFFWNILSINNINDYLIFILAYFKKLLIFSFFSEGRIASE